MSLVPRPLLFHRVMSSSQSSDALSLYEEGSCSFIFWLTASASPSSSSSSNPGDLSYRSHNVIKPLLLYGSIFVRLLPTKLHLSALLGVLDLCERQTPNVKSVAVTQVGKTSHSMTSLPRGCRSHQASRTGRMSGSLLRERGLRPT